MQGISWFLIKSWYYWNTSSLKPKLTSQKKAVILAWLFQSPNNYWDSTVPSYKMLNFIQLAFTIHYFHKDHNTPWFLPPPIFKTSVSNFSWILQSSQEKSNTMVMNFFFSRGRGVNKVHYALCKNGELFLFIGENRSTVGKFGYPFESQKWPTSIFT